MESMLKFHNLNKKAWNEAADNYEQQMDKQIQFLRSGGQNFCKPELSYLSNLNKWCHRAIHLQCAGGTDTISLLNRGAKEVIGIDLSDKMIKVAKEKSEKLNVNAKWYCCDAVSPPSELLESADLVYTGRGAIIWIHDIESWAQSIASLLKKGGYFYMFEGHPITEMFPIHARQLDVDPDYKGYFSTEVSISSNWPESYISKDQVPKNPAPQYERAWPISVVMSALLNSGLTLLKFEEHPDSYWDEFPNLPEEKRNKIPNTYSLWLRKMP